MNQHAAASPQHAADLLEAAVQASNAGEDDRALELLQHSVAASHVNPMAHYLLGAESAQRRRYGDAVLHMTTAVEQAPQLWVARLQLGLLWLTLANPGAAQVQLQPLLELPSTDALRLFGEGLLALAADDLAAAARSLAAGLQAGIANPALMADMQRLLEATEAQRRASASAGVPGVGTETAAVSHGMAISAYTGGGNGS